MSAFALTMLSRVGSLAMMRRLITIVFMSALLTACGSSKSATSSATCVEQYWDGSVGTCLPSGWSVVARDVMAARGVTGDVAIAFQKEKAVAGQFPTVTVTKENLAEGTASPAYSDASVRSVAVYQNYKQLSAQPITIDSAQVTLHVFTAQPLDGEPARRFYQVSAVGGAHTGYTFTALAPLTIPADLEKEILLIMNNVTFRERSSAAASTTE